MKYRSEFFWEFFGKMILVFLSCGSVAVTVLSNAHKGLQQVALVWGIGVTLAIFATLYLSCANLNPAVIVAMVISRRKN